LAISVRAAKKRTWLCGIRKVFEEKEVHSLLTVFAPFVQLSMEGEVEEVEEEVVEEEVEEVEEEVEEEKVVEPTPEVEEEEEDDGMEVEQITIRGRTYWIDTGSQKLYANAEGDEVGDEVGALVNGKPVFLAK
jgi:hypothetical protein